MNANLLRAKMKEVDKTQKEVAKASGMSENSLSRKIAGKRDFRLSEVERLCIILGIDDPISIFFDHIIPYTQRNMDRSGR